MLDLVFSIIEAPTQEAVADSPDWWARGISFAAFIVSATSLCFALWDRWTRKRSVLPTPLANDVKTLNNLLWAMTLSASATMDIWTATSSATIESLAEAADQVTEKKLRRWLLRYKAEILDARGSDRPSAADIADPRFLTTTRVRKANVAHATGELISKRIKAIELRVAAAK